MTDVVVFITYYYYNCFLYNISLNMKDIYASIYIMYLCI